MQKGWTVNTRSFPNLQNTKTDLIIRRHVKQKHCCSS